MCNHCNCELCITCIEQNVLFTRKLHTHQVGCLQIYHIAISMAELFLGLFMVATSSSLIPHICKLSAANNHNPQICHNSWHRIHEDALQLALFQVHCALMRAGCIFMDHYILIMGEYFHTGQNKHRWNTQTCPCGWKINDWDVYRMSVCLVCLRMWMTRLHFWLNADEQKLQANGFSPVWVRMCLFRRDGARKDSEQTLHW